MTAILRNESGRLVKGSLLLTGIIAITAAFFLAVFPGIQAEAEEFAEAFPDYLLGLLGLEDLTTLEGFAAGYIYPVAIILLVGIYVAYTAASMINEDVNARRMDLLLSNPISRESVILQKFGALWVPIVVINVGLFALMLIGAVVLGESISVTRFAMAHVLAVPYLLVCGAIGLLFSVVLRRVASAQGGALGVIFVLWILEGIAETNEMYEPIGVFTPSQYYDLNAILLHEEYAIADAGVLLLAAGVLLLVTIVIFVRRDI